MMTVSKIRELATRLNAFADTCERLKAEPEEIAITFSYDDSDSFEVTSWVEDDKNFYFYLDGRKLG